jgi:site-specific recombinase XerC
MLIREVKKYSLFSRSHHHVQVKLRNECFVKGKMENLHRYLLRHSFTPYFKEHYSISTRLVYMLYPLMNGTTYWYVHVDSKKLKFRVICH